MNLGGAEAVGSGGPNHKEHLRSYTGDVAVKKMQLQCCQIFPFSRKARNLDHMNLSSFVLGQPVQLKTKQKMLGPNRTHLQDARGLQAASV